MNQPARTPRRRRPAPRPAAPRRARHCAGCSAAIESELYLCPGCLSSAVATAAREARDAASPARRRAALRLHAALSAKAGKEGHSHV